MVGTRLSNMKTIAQMVSEEVIAGNTKIVDHTIRSLRFDETGNGRILMTAPTPSE